MSLSRRDFLAATSATALISASSPAWSVAQEAASVSVELPRGRVPLSFIIDDSTCLVNMGKFCMPQFAATYPERADYQKPWQQWPDEIPDSFVRDFGSWCAEHGVRGKYSIVPYPACVGWLDRTLPGWSQRQLQDSLKLVRELMVPNWDIHPEMISHTRVLDLKTGRPFADYSPDHMENSYPQQDVSVDYLASYLAYALQILKNCDLPCEGITTPGGFGTRVKDKLPLAVFEAVRDVYGTELPHYFKYVASGDESVVPKLEAVRDLDTDAPRVTANVLAGTGDWFGGWDGVLESQGAKYATADASSGRMVELIEKRQPAVMLCHWAGLYNNGGRQGFHDFQQVVTALAGRFSDQTQWMKISDIGRYWVARELTQIEHIDGQIRLQAPYACREFTLRLQRPGIAKAVLTANDPQVAQQLSSVSTLPSLAAGTYYNADNRESYICFDLPKGQSVLNLS